MRRARALAVALLAAGALTACGTTVSLGSSSAQLPVGDGLGLDAPQTPTTGTTGGVVDADGPTPEVVAQSPVAEESTAVDGGGVTSAPSATSRFPLNGFGYTASTINLGYGISSDNSATVLGAFGVAGVEDPGDLKAQLTAAIEDRMKHGGFAGRRINLIPHAYSTTEILNDPSSAAQKACSDLTQDHQVVAMVSLGVTNDTAKTCFNKAGVLMLVNAGLENPPAFQASTYKRYPTYIGIGSMSGDRYFSGAVQRLVARDFFQKWNTGSGAAGGSAPVKIGALVLDNPSGEETLATYKREVAKLGYTISDVVRLPEQVSSAIAAGSSAVLRFHSEGITHVLGITLPFASTAQQQGYHPRYYVNVAMQVVAQSAPVGQLHGAMAISYVPAFDTDVQHDPGLPTEASSHCLAVMKAAHLVVANQTTKLSMEAACDTASTLQAALLANGGDLSSKGLIRGYELLGSKIPLAVTWSSIFGKGEHASARALRDMSYNASCKCFVYPDKVNHVIP